MFQNLQQSTSFAFLYDKWKIGYRSNIAYILAVLEKIHGKSYGTLLEALSKLGKVFTNSKR